MMKVIQLVVGSGCCLWGLACASPKAEPTVAASELKRISIPTPVAVSSESMQITGLETRVQNVPIETVDVQANLLRFKIATGWVSLSPCPPNAHQMNSQGLSLSGSFYRAPSGPIIRLEVFQNDRSILFAVINAPRGYELPEKVQLFASNDQGSSAMLRLSADRSIPISKGAPTSLPTETGNWQIRLIRAQIPSHPSSGEPTWDLLMWR